MSPAVGDRLGPYEILGPLGSGGMGKVYRARDSRLDRVVAIKVAHERFGERVDREARAIARLNHPNICTVHDVGPDYLVMELIEGETLADRLKRGAPEVPEALATGAAVARGLAAAHAEGIVHRDLKPQNIMLTRDGVKVLDFGVAKCSADLTQTDTSVLVGTPAYLPPEQRRGAPVDARTDHYALGLILIEMLAGARTDPEQPRLPDHLSPRVAAAVGRCVARDPEGRWQSASDLAAVLGQLATEESRPAREVSRSRPSRWWLAGAAAAVLTAAVIGAMVTRQLTSPPQIVRLPPPDGTTFPTVSVGGAPALSPDGARIAFVAEGETGRQLWVQSLDTLAAQALAGTDGATHPSWSPDGETLTFFTDTSLKSVARDGRDVRTLAPSRGAGPATWNQHGQILWSGGGMLRRISASGGEASNETERDSARFEENHYAPSFLPDGQRYLVLVRGGVDLHYELSVGALGSSQRHALLNGVSSARYAPPASRQPGSILFAREGQLFAQQFDDEGVALKGPVTLVADRVGEHSFGFIADFDVSPAGVLAFRGSEPARQELAWLDRDGRQVGSIGDRPGNRRNNVRLSRNGRSVAFVRETSGVPDVWVADFDRGTTTRVTFDGGRSPVWSPDGSEMAYLRGDTIVRKPLAGGGAEIAVWKGSGILSLNDWSGDGRHFLLTRWDPDKGMEGRALWLLSTGTRGEAPTPVLFEKGLHGQFAPAIGAPRWIAYDGAGGTFVRDMPGSGEGKWQVSVDGGNAVRWRPDAGELFFVSGPSFVTVAVEPGPTFRHGSPRRLFVAPPSIRVAQSQYALGYDVATDGQRFLTTYPTTEARPSSITVVRNWQSMLKP